MRVSLCTITFRHHLISLDEIARFARDNAFQGIELWGIHARNAARQPRFGKEWLAGYGLHAPMLSDYLPTEGDTHDMRVRAAELGRLARHWGAAKIRTFAGTRPSAATSAAEFRRVAARLRELCDIAAAHDVRLLVETHPNTLADTLASTLRLIGEVDHASLRINFDTLHVWEGGDDPLAAHEALAPYVAHYHLKNIRSRADLSVFAPDNVYAAAGTRQGMTPLLDGILDYRWFLASIGHLTEAEASLEWFGHDPFDVLAHDRVDVANIVASSYRTEDAGQRRSAAGL